MVSPDSLAAASTRSAVIKARCLEPCIAELESVLFNGDVTFAKTVDIRKAHQHTVVTVVDLMMSSQTIETHHTSASLVWSAEMLRVATHSSFCIACFVS